MSGWEFGTRHPDGCVTVMITGHAFGSHVEAQREAARFDAGDEFGECPECPAKADQGQHAVVQRYVGEWCDAAEVDRLFTPGSSWLDELAQASESAAEAKFGPEFGRDACGGGR